LASKAIKFREKKTQNKGY